MKNRIKEIRTAVNKNQTDFAKSISISRSAICKMESGENFPSEQTITLICRVYNVNEHWIKTGEGEMFNAMTIDEELSAFLGDLLNDQENGFQKRLITALKRLRPDQWDLLEEIIDTVNDMKKE